MNKYASFLDGLDKEAFLMNLAGKAATKIGKNILKNPLPHLAIGGATLALGGSAVDAVTQAVKPMALTSAEYGADNAKEMFKNNYKPLDQKLLQHL